MKVLFVCTGNICRSPTAERLATALATQRQLSDFTASSAGTRAMIGHPIHRDAIPPLEQHGGDAAGFAARQLKPAIAREADLVLTMTTAHRDRVLELAPQQLRRTFTLIEAFRIISELNAQTAADLTTLRPHLNARHSVDIADPIGRDGEFFAMVGAQIAALLPPIIDLCRRSSAG